MGEIQKLKDWFDTNSECAQLGFADYFSAELPEEACSTAKCRCSRCWNDPVKAADLEPEPALFRAFIHHTPAAPSPALDAQRMGRLKRDSSTCCACASGA